MELIKLSKETDGIQLYYFDGILNGVIFVWYDWIWTNKIEYSWEFYLKIEIKLIVITHKFITTSLKFYITNNLGHMHMIFT